MGTDIVSIDNLNADTVVTLLSVGGLEGVKLSFPKEDSSVIAQRIAQRDFEATNVDELFGGKESEAAKDWVGKPFHLVDVEFLPSDIADAPLPFFALLHVATLDGESKAISTGAATIVRKVAVAKARGWLPVTLKITKAATTEAGFNPLDIVKVSDHDLPF